MRRYLTAFAVFLAAAAILNKIAGAILITSMFIVIVLHKAYHMDHTPIKTAQVGVYFGAILGVVMGFVVIIEKGLDFGSSVLTLLTGTVFFAFVGAGLFYVIYCLVHPKYDLLMIKRLLRP